MQSVEELPVVWVYWGGDYLDVGRQVEVEGQTEIHFLSVLVDGQVIDLIERDIDASGKRRGSVEFGGKNYEWKIF